MSPTKAIAKPFKGVFSFLVTPTKDDGETLDEARLRRLIDDQIEAGVDGLTVFGSTGAIGSFSEEERRRVIKITVGHAAGRVPVVAGTGAMTTSGVIALSQYAADEGADAVLVVPITYWPLKDNEILGHYEAIASAVDVPLGIYNNPTTTGTDIKPELIARLAELDRVAFVKESSGDSARISTIRQLTRRSIAVMNGKDSKAPQAFAAGADGWFSGAANLLTEYCVKLFAIGHVDKDFDKVRERFELLYPIFDLMSQKSTIRVVHSGLEIQGRSAGELRRPIRNLLPEDRKRLSLMLADLEAAWPVPAARVKEPA